MTRPIWAEVSLGRLQHNFRTVKQHVGPDTEICAVVKCDAYGHGVEECSQALEAAGAKWLGVTSVEEGVKVRSAGIKGRILVMTGFWHGEEEALITNDLTATVWTADHVRFLCAAARKLGYSREAVHLKVDTGMTRLGSPIEDLPEVFAALESAGALDPTGTLFVEGMFSHLASAEVLDATDALEQIERFEHALQTAGQRGFHPYYVHMANSAAVAGRPNTWKSIVRPGLLLYGYQLPFIARNGKSQVPPPLSLKPVLSWKARIISLRNVGGNQPLGYNGAYVTPAPAKIAAIPVGYGDGLSRHLSSRGQVLVRGEYAQMVGNVAMDLTLLDVTHIPNVQIGDEVVLIGEQDGKRVTALEQARWAQTIPYEILCGLSPRVPRVYVE
jgi:alanine racemase